ncbi:EamA family transporter [Acidaminobacter hydrogenoformans]|uniref:EamA-like transporter family protein n=1 Tax=Acidaminobacter hydrogenoformans DSM 2784 TaxID=1120920 RepID=A0A1G5S7A1_9FIRM|nr:EamA family transporter [Acidaminobacter hydrogenoformans]SCZ81469.1 EamA-like transporter family protein [Acidaminobacter hydrogenoformans DSM 2784]
MSKYNSKEIFNWIAYLTVCVVWGSTYLAINIGVSGIAPLFFTSLRFLTAGTIMVLFAKLRGFAFPTVLREYIQLGVIGLLLLFGGTGFVGLASRYISSGSTSLIVASSPLIMAVFQMILYPQLRNNDWRVWFGLLVGFGGVGLLIFSGGGEMSLDPRGVALVLTAVTLWSIGTLYSRTVKPQCHVVVQIGLQMLIAGVGIMLISFAAGESHSLQASTSSLLALLYLVIFGSILAYSAFIHIIQAWPLSRASTYAYINPVIAVLLGWLVLSEPVTPSILLSMVVILSGVILVQTASLRRKPVLQKSDEIS